MQHFKFQDHSTTDSGEEDFLRFYHILAWWTSRSCDLDHLYTLSFPLPKAGKHKIWHRLAKQFQRKRCLKPMVIYMYIAPGQGQTTPGVIFSH